MKSLRSRTVNKENMKRVVMLVLICMLACSLFAGCKSDTPPDLSKKPKTEAGSVKEQESTKTDKKKKRKKRSEDKEEKKERKPDVLSGEALYLDEKVIFRVYDYSAYDLDGLFGEFLRNYHAYEPNAICSFDPKAPENGITKLCDDYGTGTMYLINGEDLYSQCVAEGPEDANNWRVYKRHLSEGEAEEICNGQIGGFSPDGKRFTVYEYSYDDEYTEHYRIYSTEDAGLEAAHYETTGIATYLGMDYEGAYLLEKNDGDTYDVIKLTNDGREYYLASCDFSKLDPEYGAGIPQYDGQISFDGENMTFQVDYYEGTGHFYYGSVKTSVPVAAEGESFDTPLYEPQMEEVEPERDNDGIVDPEDIVPEKIKNFAYDYPAYESGSAVANVLQYHEELADGLFYVMAQCHKDPLEDIGWRESYSLLNVRYYFLAAGDDTPVLLHTMFEPLGKRGSLTKYEWYERQPTVFAYAMFIPGEDGRFERVLYEPINVMGPEMPIDTSNVYYTADIADEFYYEHPHNDDLYEDFDVDGLDEFCEMIKNESYGKPPVKSADAEMKIEVNDNVYMCHLAFDEDKRVYYIRPVIME